MREFKLRTKLAILISVLLVVGCDSGDNAFGANNPDSEITDPGTETGSTDGGSTDSGITDSGSTDGKTDGSGDDGSTDGVNPPNGGPGVTTDGSTTGTTDGSTTGTTDGSTTGGTDGATTGTTDGSNTGGTDGSTTGTTDGSTTGGTDGSTTGTTDGSTTGTTDGSTTGGTDGSTTGTTDGSTTGGTDGSTTGTTDGSTTGGTDGSTTGTTDGSTTGGTDGTTTGTTDGSTTGGTDGSTTGTTDGSTTGGTDGSTTGTTDGSTTGGTDGSTTGTTDGSTTGGTDGSTTGGTDGSTTGGTDGSTTGGTDGSTTGTTDGSTTGGTDGSTTGTTDGSTTGGTDGSTTGTTDGSTTGGTDGSTTGTTDGSTTGTTDGGTTDGGGTTPSVLAGSVNEGDPGDQVKTSGELNEEDSQLFTNQNRSGSYGSLALADGVWTYTLDQSKVQALYKDEIVKDEIDIIASDNSKLTVVIEITGTDDEPVISGDDNGTINLWRDSGFEGDLYEVRAWRRGDDYSIIGSGFNGINILTDGTTLQFIDNDSKVDRGGINYPNYYTYEGDDTQRVIIDGKTYSYMVWSTGKYNFSGRSVTVAYITVDLDGNGRTPYLSSDSNEYAAFIVPVSGSFVKGTSASAISGSGDTPTLTYTQLGATMTSFDASGSIGVTDVDSDNSTVTFDGTGPYEGNFGSLVIVNGTWTYTVNDTAVSDFTEETVVQDVIEVTASDGVTTTDIVITIGGSQAAIDQYLNPQPPESFNLLTVESGSSETLTFPVSLEWEKSELATGYTVCRQNEDFDNDCEPLGTTDGALELTVGMTGALSALSSEFFIISTNSVGSASSNLLSLSSTDANDLIASIKASDPSQSARFGYSVSISRDGTVFAAGAPYKNTARGAAYIFRFTDGLWQQEELLTSPNIDANDYYGWAVALSEDGTTLVVGAPQEDGSNLSVSSCCYNNDSGNSGAAYVYRFENDAWVFQRYLKADNAGSDDRFGRSVALSSDGNKVLIGAPGEDSSTTGINSTSNNSLSSWAGAAYLFSFDGGAWSQELYIKASNPGSSDKFGESVAMSGDGNTLAVGAVGESSSTTGINTTPNDASTNAGATYVFENSDGSWAQQAYVKASNAGGGDQFGMSVSLSSDGNTLAVGAMYEDSNTTGINSTPNNSLSDTGAVYVFQRNVDSWSQQAYVKASTVHSGMWFGNSVAMSPNGTSLVVGAWREDSSSVGINSTPNVSAPQSGAAYLFNFDGSEWSQGAYLKSPMPDWNEYFGNSVDVSDNNNVIVGAPEEGSSSTGFRSGEVYLY